MRGTGRAARRRFRKLVKPGGRVVMLTFMSLEDRKVKQSFQAMAQDGRAQILTRHVVRPAEEEITGQSAVAQRQAARGGDCCSSCGSIQPWAFPPPVPGAEG